MSTKLKTVSIDSRDFDVYVQDNGTFKANYSGEWLNAPTLNALTEKIRKKVRAEGTAVPATLVEEPSVYDREDSTAITFTDIELTGIHGGTGNALYREVGQTAGETLNKYRATLTRRLTPDERAEWQRVFDAKCAADRAHEELVESHTTTAKALLAKLTYETPA